MVTISGEHGLISLHQLSHRAYFSIQHLLVIPKTFLKKICIGFWDTGTAAGDGDPMQVTFVTAVAAPSWDSRESTETRRIEIIWCYFQMKNFEVHSIL